MEIRLATQQDIPQVMQFIKEHWGAQHILANNRAFMEYQHCGKKDVFTYIIAQEDGIIYGVEGYIPMNSKENPDISGALWKVIPNGYFMLGKAIRDYLMQLTKCRCLCSPGINMNTSGKVLGAYGQYVEKMEHYYRIRDFAEYRIAIIKEKCIPKSRTDSKVHLKPISDFETMATFLSEEYLSTKLPYKNMDYLKHRYFEHPIYKYDVYAIINGDKQKSFVVVRAVDANDSKIGKIVDFIGEDEAFIGLEKEWDKLMLEKGYEYIDIYCYGIAPKFLEQSGFVKRKEDDVNIIPNYFEPYEAKNVDIYFVSNVLGQLHLYRGDGDQDRPNWWKKN